LTGKPVLFSIVRSRRIELTALLGPFDPVGDFFQVGRFIAAQNEFSLLGFRKLIPSAKTDSGSA
jgi:hypothetical protein